MIFLLFTFAALAADMPKSTFTFRQGSQAFVTDEKQHLTVSTSCLKPDGSFHCEAVKNLKDLSWKKRRKGQQNPASVLCDSQLHGTVVVGLSEAKDENSFCRFSDGSMVDGGSLIYRARKND